MSAFRFSGRHQPPVARSIHRPPSPVIAYATPWVTIVLASILTTLPTIASAPIIPPLGYLMLLGWRQLRPGLLPVWAGIPLGLADDLFSGQSMGCGIMLWSLSMLLLDLIEFRFPWRNFVIEWMVATGMIVAYLASTTLVANLAGGATGIDVILPQLLLSILLYPVIGRIVAQFDRWRLGRVRIFG